MAILIRPEVSDDIELIDKIVAAAFGSNDEAKLVRLIRERDESIMSLVLTILPVLAAFAYGIIGGDFFRYISIVPLIALVVGYLGMKKLQKL